jgi:L1 cell adhesion molecule like protein
LTRIPPAPRGVPQIEETIDANADGIMNVSAQDKSTGNVTKITIKNEKGRLSQADIDRMVSDVEKFKTADEELKKKIEARNALEGYCFGVRNSINQSIKNNLQQVSNQMIMRILKMRLTTVCLGSKIIEKQKCQCSKQNRKNLKEN